jgi:membrane-bound lytic murein transglycosylase
MIISPEFLDAYHAAEFEVVFDAGKKTFKTGQRINNLSELASTTKVTKIAIVTAYNPFSVLKSKEENELQHKKLIAAVKKSRRKYFPAAGIDPNAKWNAEISLAIVNPSDTELNQWLIEFNQNAIVIIEPMKPIYLQFHPNVLLS